MGWSRFKFNNLRLALAMALKFYTSLEKGLKVKVRMFWGLSPTFVEVTGEKLVGGIFAPPILTRVNFVSLNTEHFLSFQIHFFTCLNIKNDAQPMSGTTKKHVFWGGEEVRNILSTTCLRKINITSAFFAIAKKRKFEGL